MLVFLHSFRFKNKELYFHFSSKNPSGTIPNLPILLEIEFFLINWRRAERSWNLEMLYIQFIVGKIDRMSILTGILKKENDLFLFFCVYPSSMLAFLCCAWLLNAHDEDISLKSLNNWKFCECRRPNKAVERLGKHNEWKLNMQQAKEHNWTQSADIHFPIIDIVLEYFAGNAEV